MRLRDDIFGAHDESLRIYGTLIELDIDRVSDSFHGYIRV